MAMSERERKMLLARRHRRMQLLAYKLIAAAVVVIVLLAVVISVIKKKDPASGGQEASNIAADTQTAEYEPSETTETSDNTETEEAAADVNSTEEVFTGSSDDDLTNDVRTETISWDSSWGFAENSKVHDSSVTLYLADSTVNNGFTVAVNAGHGSKAAQQVKTLCHPDGTAKVTSGSTAAGETEAPGASTGTTFLDGTAEATVTLELAIKVKETLLAKGYNVLMIRETEDCDLDNIARTVYANNNADCHIALHYDSTETDKGLYYTSVPDVESYRSMYPVSDTWEMDNALGDALLEGCAEAGIAIWDSGSLESDLTQTSYSTIPSVDLEVGDRASDYSDPTLEMLAEGITNGIDVYFGQ